MQSIDVPQLELISAAVRRGNPAQVDEEIEELKRSVSDLREKTVKHYSDWTGLLQNRLFAKALSFLSDAEYIRGNFSEALNLTRVPAQWIRKNILVRREKISGDEERRLRRQQVWLVTCHAAACIRVGELKQAKETLEQASAFVNEHLRSAGFPCYGTRARIAFYTGLLARNSGEFFVARKEFDRATEMAIARCDHALMKKGRPANYRESEVLFKKRCLARVQAFGKGLSSLSEGRLLNARAAFYLALELLEDPKSAGAERPNYRDELMANQVWLWLILVRTMLIAFNDEGVEQLQQMFVHLTQLNDWFGKRTGDFEPDCQLCQATMSLVCLRLKQCSSEVSEPAPVRSGGSLKFARRPQSTNAQAETDLPNMITHLVQAWVAIDGDPSRARETISRLASADVKIPFWRNEINLAMTEAAIETTVGRMEAADAPVLSDITRDLKDSISQISHLTDLTIGQSIVAEATKSRAYVLLGDCSRKAGQPEESAEWKRIAASIAIRVRARKVHSGILAWKIQGLPPGDIPERMPMPDEAGYPRKHIDLVELIAVRNAIVECIRRKPALLKNEMAKFLEEEIALTPERARGYVDTFPELREWLVAKGPPRGRGSEHSKLVHDYTDFLARRSIGLGEDGAVGAKS